MEETPKLRSKVSRSGNLGLNQRMNRQVNTKTSKNPVISFITAPLSAPESGLPDVHPRYRHIQSLLEQLCPNQVHGCDREDDTDHNQVPALKRDQAPEEVPKCAS